MTIESGQPGPEKKYRSWYQDPEQVEHLVMMLEEKMIDPKTGEERWKYGTGRVHEVLFPTKKTPWARKYTKAPTPFILSFQTSMARLQSGEVAFGKEIPPELAERFDRVIEARRGDRGMQNPREAWDNPRKLLLAGLVEYCGFTAKEAARLLTEKFAGTIYDGFSVATARSQWKKNREYPYEHDTVLREDAPKSIVFVEYLRIFMDMSLYDLRNHLKQRKSEKRGLERLNRFIESHERYHATHFSNTSPNTSEQK
jgi:hypothetical protein